MISSQAPHSKLLDSVAERYRSDGYQVITEPGPSVIPFDLGFLSEKCKLFSIPMNS